MPNDIERTEQIAVLNDMLRQSQLTGDVAVSSGIRALCPEVQNRILQGVKTYKAFAPQGDAQAERDFGAFMCGDHDIFWKITCYDEHKYYLSDDAADINCTKRVLRVMLVEEH